MSRIPEFIFKTALVKGFETFRQDPQLIQQVFRNLTLESIDENVRFFQQQNIQIDVNFPSEPPMLPAIIILLKGESEEETFLNDFAERGTPGAFSYEGEIEGQIIGGTSSLSSLTGEDTIVFGPHKVISSTTNTVYIGTEEFSISELVGQNFTLSIVAGKGAGQYREIVANGPNYIMVDSNWTTKPDNTSVLQITKAQDEVWGEPPKLYNRRDITHVIERQSIMYRASCVFNIIGSNPEQAIVMCTLVKAILMAMKLSLEKQGILKLKMAATDLNPLPDYFPTIAFSRALNVEFSYEFDIFNKLGPVINQINFTFEKLNVELSSGSANIAPTADSVSG